jgi:hypothetical protein
VYHLPVTIPDLWITEIRPIADRAEQHQAVPRGSVTMAPRLIIVQSTIGCGPTGSNPVSLLLVSLGYRGLPSREVYPVLRISSHSVVKGHLTCVKSGPAYLIYAFLGMTSVGISLGKM